MADDLAIYGTHHFIVTPLNKVTSGTISTVVIYDVVKVLVYMCVSRPIRRVTKFTFHVEQNCVGTGMIRPK